MSNTVHFCGMGLTQDEVKLAEKISSVLTDRARNRGIGIDVTIHDVEAHGELNADVCMLFGAVIGVEAKHKRYDAPKLSRMLSVNEDTDALKMRVMEFIDDIIENFSHKNEEDKMYVEAPNGITVGGAGADIQITEEEAIHLKKIKDILGGGKIVIQKGDLRIEVEPNE